MWDLTDRSGTSVSVLLFDGGSDDRVLHAAAEVGAIWFGRDVPVHPAVTGGHRAGAVSGPVGDEGEDGVGHQLNGDRREQQAG